MFQKQVMNPAERVFMLKIIIKMILGKSASILAKPLSSETARCSTVT